MNLEYYVLNSDMNTHEIKPFNIFRNWPLEEATIKEIKKYLRAPGRYKHTKHHFGNVPEETYYGFEAFVKELDSLIMWQEWSRCEYEIYVSDMFDKEDRRTKIDCYEQCKPNMEMIAREVIYQYKKQSKEEKESNNGRE